MIEKFTDDDFSNFEASYKSALERANRFQGMMGEISIALFTFFTQFQRKIAAAGNLVEFGVFRGRSAAVSLGEMNPSERMLLVDVATYPEFDKLREINDSFDFVQGKSEELTTDARLLDHLRTGIRFSHHDASHTYRNVSEEIKLLAPYIQPGGLMVIDDFGNPHFMQVVAAVFAFLAQDDCELEMGLYAFNKAYIWRKADYPLFAPAVLQNVLPCMKLAGFNLQITRTDRVEKYRAFSLVAKKQAGDDDYYGLKTYGDQFYRI